MESVNVSIAVPKESKEVLDAAAAIIQHFVDGKPIAEAAALLPAVMSAVDGYNKIGDELKSSQNDELAGYAVYKILGSLKKSVVPVPA